MKPRMLTRLHIPRPTEQSEVRGIPVVWNASICVALPRHQLAQWFTAWAPRHIYKWGGVNNNMYVRDQLLQRKPTD